MKKTERYDALCIITQLLQTQTPLSWLMQAHPHLSAFSKELCFGVSRQYHRLAMMAHQLVPKQPKETDIWVCLLLGIYQLHYLKIPDYAVVKETVALVTQIKKPWAKGLVNAVLRRFCREHAVILQRLAKNPAFQHNHPAWFVERVKQDWPHHWNTILEANDTHPPMTLRINQQKQSREVYVNHLKTAGMSTHIDPLFPPECIQLETPCPVSELPKFEAGGVSVQDGAAQLAAHLLQLEPGLRVLDACCAPGGKTCHILELEPHLTHCCALDIDDKRLARVRSNLTRLALSCQVLSGNALTPNTWWDGVHFDRILLDAPCSASGVIRRHPDIKLLRNAAAVAEITKMQQALLNALWPLLTPGGFFLYATCSIFKEENEQQIIQFLSKHSDATWVERPFPWGHPTGHGWQILPGEHGMDGFFYSLITKHA